VLVTVDVDLDPLRQVVQRAQLVLVAVLLRDGAVVLPVVRQRLRVRRLLLVGHEDQRQVTHQELVLALLLPQPLAEPVSLLVALALPPCVRMAQQDEAVLCGHRRGPRRCGDERNARDHGAPGEHGADREGDARAFCHFVFPLELPQHNHEQSLCSPISGVSAPITRQTGQEPLFPFPCALLGALLV